jgi:hypothetical protein
MPGGAWIATGVDPRGLDLRAGAMRARIDFPAKVRTSDALRTTLVRLAAEARAKA